MGKMSDEDRQELLISAIYKYQLNDRSEIYLPNTKEDSLIKQIIEVTEEDYDY